MEQSSSTKTRKGAGVAELEERIQVLEDALAKIATLSGHGNHLAEFGLKRWIPTKADLGKKWG